MSSSRGIVVTNEYVTIKGMVMLRFRVMMKGVTGQGDALMFQAGAGTKGHISGGMMMLPVDIIRSDPMALRRTAFPEEGTVDDTVLPRGSEWAVIRI